MKVFFMGICLFIKKVLSCFGPCSYYNSQFMLTIDAQPSTLLYLMCYSFD